MHNLYTHSSFESVFTSESDVTCLHVPDVVYVEVLSQNNYQSLWEERQVNDINH